MFKEQTRYLVKDLKNNKFYTIITELKKYKLTLAWVDSNGNVDIRRHDWSFIEDLVNKGSWVIEKELID